MGNISFTSCIKATELTEKQLSFGLSIVEGIRLRIHHSICNACRNYHRHSLIIDAILNYQIHHPKHFQPISTEIAQKTAQTILKKISQ